MTNNIKLSLFALVPFFAVLSLPGIANGAEPEFRRGFALRLWGGLGYQTIGDLNTGQKGFIDSIVYYDTGHGFTSSGGYQDVHYGFDLGGDIVFQFSPAFGVRIGTGYLRSSESSGITLTGAFVMKHSFVPAVSAVPIRASFFAFVPLGRALKISASAGVEYYLASISTKQRFEYIGLSFILEGQGRWAQVKELSGTYRYINSYGSEFKVEGPLYYWTDLYYFKPFPYIFINDVLPSEPWQVDARKATLDLSGGSLTAGFVFRF